MVSASEVIGTLLTFNAADGRTWMIIDGTVGLVDDDGTGPFHGNEGEHGYVEQPLIFRPTQTPRGWSDIDGVSYSVYLNHLYNWGHAIWPGWTVRMGIGNETWRPTILNPQTGQASGFIELMCTVGSVIMMALCLKLVTTSQQLGD